MGKYRNQIQFEDAEREQLYAKIAIMGASGSGKTVSALKLAYGLTGGDWSKVYMGDTENKRSLAYRGTTHTGLEIGRFKHVPLAAPYDTEKFMDLIDVAHESGAEVLIIDSMSHQWEGLGGVLDENEEQGSDFWAWKGPKKKHHALKDHIQQVPMHIITTMRTKQEYAVIPGGGKNGKNGIQKLGMKPVQENAFDYEFLLAFHIDEDNIADVKKDNTGLFRGEEFKIEVDHGAKLRTWLVEGKEVKSVSQEKQEEENDRQALIEKFTKQRKSHEKFESFFTTQEIKKNNIKIKDWPLKALQSLDEQLTAAAESKAKLKAAREAALKEQQEAPAEDNAAPAEEEVVAPELDRTAVLLEIETLCKDDESVLAAAKEFMKKNKVRKFTSLKDDKLAFLLDLVRIKAKSAEKEKEAVTS